MRLQRFIGAGTVAVLLLALLSACGGAPATGTTAGSAAASEAASTSAGSSGSTIPLYTGAQPLDANSPIAAALAPLKQQIQQQQSAANVTVDAYTLPAGATFDQVKKFYNDALTADGWTDATGQTTLPTLPGGGAAIWQKNGAEAVTVVVGPNPISGGSFMMVARVTPK